MKLNKKKVFAASLALCLVAILSMGSLAWFTDADDVTNKFMIADSADTEEEIFSVDVVERVDADGDGKYDDGLKDTGITYENILPGDVLLKQPIVKNTGYYDQYVRVTVTLSDANAWQTVYGTDDVALNKVVNGLNEAALYASYSYEDTAADALVYVLYYRKALQAGGEFTVFDSVNVPTSMTAAQAALFNQDTNAGFTLDVFAEAVQIENVGDNVFEAYKTVKNDVTMDTMYVTTFEELQAAINNAPNGATVKLVNDING